MTARHEVCRTCAHWCPFPAGEWIDAETAPLGECRAFPPEVRWFQEEGGEPGFKTAFPNTRAEQWCGEWFPGAGRDD
jgi:hypothetical protein